MDCSRQLLALCYARKCDYLGGLMTVKSSGLSAVYPIKGLTGDSLFAKVIVIAEVDGRPIVNGKSLDECLLMHINQQVDVYESNIVTFDTSTGRPLWQNGIDSGASAMLTTYKGIAIAYLGFGMTNPMRGAATVMAELTVGIKRFPPPVQRLITGTSYTDTEKLEGRQHNQRYLSQIGGEIRDVTNQVAGFSFSTLNGIGFALKTVSIVAV